MTEVTKTLPSYNPADVNTLDGLNNIFLNKIMMNIDCVIPGIVQSYDKTTNRAVIKPAITGVASQGQKVPKEPFVNIPVFMPSAAGCMISFPISPNDTGWLIACDRNISIFKQNKTESAPNDFRKHKFEDAFFLPDTINHLGSDGLTIDAGSKELALKTTDRLSINGTAGLADGDYPIQNSTTKITVKQGIITGIS